MSFRGVVARRLKKNQAEVKVCCRSVHTNHYYCGISLALGKVPGHSQESAGLRGLYDLAEMRETKMPSRHGWKSRHQRVLTGSIVTAQSYSKRSHVDSIPLPINSTGLTLTSPHQTQKKTPFPDPNLPPIPRYC